MSVSLLAQRRNARPAIKLGGPGGSMPPVPARIPDMHVFSCPPHRGGHGKDHRRSTPAAAPNVCNRAQSRTLRRMVQESAVSIQPVQVQQVTTIIFIARQHTDENGLIYRDSFFSPYGSPIILVLLAANIFTKFRRGHYKLFPLCGR